MKHLAETARRMLADHKGLLAMDESNCTSDKRFAKAGITQTAEARRRYRELIVTTPGRAWANASVASFSTTRRSDRRGRTGLPSSRSLPTQASSPASRSIRARKISPDTLAKRSPRDSTDCGSAFGTISKWARDSPSGGP